VLLADSMAPPLAPPLPELLTSALARLVALDAALGAPAGASAAALLGLAVLVLLLLLSSARALASPRARAQRSTVLVCGPPGGGKSALAHALLFGRAPETISGLSENELRGPLRARAGEFGEPPAPGAPGQPVVTLVDFPGAALLRRPLLRRAERAGAVCLVVDAAGDAAHLAAAADLAFDLLTSRALLAAAAAAPAARPPLLVVANKADARGARSPAALRKAIEEELARLRRSRGAVAVAGAAEEDEPAELTVKPGGAFDFDDEGCAAAFGAVRWCAAASAGDAADVEAVAQWLRDVAGEGQ